MTTLCEDHTWAGEGECPSCEIAFRGLVPQPDNREVTLSVRIQELADQMTRGSVRDLAYRLGLNEIYLKRLHEGSQMSPSEDVIERLGLRRITTYVRKP